ECMPPEACVARYQRLLQRVSSLPEVMDAEVANSVPLDGVVSSVPVDIELRPKTADNPAPLLWFGSVSSGYLELLNIPLVAGRYFSDADMKSSEPVAILDVAAARRVFPAQDPIGKHVRPSGSPEWRKVVGVVRGVKHFRLDRELPDGMIGAMYMPHSQTLDTSGNVPAAMTLLAKVNSADGDTLREIEALVRRENADAPVSSAEVLTDAVGRSTAEARSTVLVFLSFAGSAMLLAAVGVYGLMSYWVSQRTYEIGLRLAVGCTRKGILYMIVRQGFRLTLIGVAGGVAGALMVTRFLTTQLYGVGATDPVTFVVVTGLILGIALLAMTAPAWRATRVDPLLALRVE
ncbi:MAG TPA: FtsX-like permease family protein, partial [Bryobacteraceae bacterium]|nr:FtsX-like permease family protein [Bryobacteraceae bacterium]